MTKQDWLTVGMKLIGVYFAVIGFTVLCISVISLTVQAFYPYASPYIVARSGGFSSLLELLQPVAYMIASYYLIKKTDWCLSKIGIQIDKASEQSAAPLPRDPQTGHSEGGR